MLIIDVFILFYLTSAQPKAKLTAGPTTIPVGGSVTLSCSVEPSAGWKYRWFRKTKIIPEVQLTDEENRDINVKQGGIYRCVGVRGKTNFHSVVSDEVNITIRFSNEVVVTRPNWPHIFSGETITLTCEVQGGETTEWTCEWRRDEKTVARRNDKDWTVSVSESSSGDYMCQCRRRDDWYSVTKWSEKVPVSVSAQPKAKLTAGPTKIPVGGSVTLSCSVEPSTGWKYRWLRRTSDTPEVQLTDEENRDINVKQGGIYRCVGERGKTNFHSVVSDEVNITIRLSTPGSSSSPVLMIVGPVSGILLVLLLVLLWYYRLSKDLRWPGWKLLRSRFRVNNGFNKNEADDSSSPLHGDDHIYESVNFSEPSGNGFKPRDVTYSLIELKNFGKDSTPNEPAEGAVYHCLEPGMEGRGSPGAKEAAVYSEINSGPENNNTM
uniref:Ig-like domain-containing protein n=1 Tax=Poecilia mexicana TaxID=48701 RepID=A0A3B3X7S4_9TELE